MPSELQSPYDAKPVEELSHIEVEHFILGGESDGETIVADISRNHCGDVTIHAWRFEDASDWNDETDLNQQTYDSLIDAVLEL